MKNRNYWLGVVSRSHIQIGVKGGFIQPARVKALVASVKQPMVVFR